MPAAELETGLKLNKICQEEFSGVHLKLNQFNVSHSVLISKRLLARWKKGKKSFNEHDSGRLFLSCVSLHLFCPRERKSFPFCLIALRWDTETISTKRLIEYGFGESRTLQTETVTYAKRSNWQFMNVVGENLTKVIMKRERRMSNAIKSLISLIHHVIFGLNVYTKSKTQKSDIKSFSDERNVTKISGYASKCLKRLWLISAAWFQLVNYVGGTCDSGKFPMT